jgi:hypothetical protein
VHLVGAADVMDWCVGKSRLDEFESPAINDFVIS